MRQPIARFLPACATLALVACSTPYSLIDGYRYSRAAIDTYPVTVTAVDGKDYLRNPVQVEPGPRQITVQAPPVDGFRFGEKRTVMLDVKPCTRYHLVAVKQNRLSQQYDVKIDYEEPVPGCSRPG